LDHFSCVIVVLGHGQRGPAMREGQDVGAPSASQHTSCTTQGDGGALHVYNLADSHPARSNADSSTPHQTRSRHRCRRYVTAGANPKPSRGPCPCLCVRLVPVCPALACTYLARACACDLSCKWSTSPAVSFPLEPLK